MRPPKRRHIILAAIAMAVVLGAWAVCTSVRRANYARLEQLEEEQWDLTPDSCHTRLQAFSGAFLSPRGHALRDKITAENLFDRGRTDEADSLCKAALQYFYFHTDDSVRIADLYVLSGLIKREQHNWMGVADAFMEAKTYGHCMRHDADFAYFINSHLARICQENDLPTQALACLRESLAAARRLNDRKYLCDAWRQLARYHFERGEYAAARIYQDSLLGHALPGDTRVREEAAHTCLHLHEPAQAIALLDACTGKHPSPDWWSLRGEAFEQLGMADSAASCYRRLMAAWPAHPKGYEGLFRLAYDAGRFRQAADHAHALMAGQDSLRRQHKKFLMDKMQMLNDYRRRRKDAEEAEYRHLLQENRLIRALLAGCLVTALLAVAYLLSRKRRLKAENRLLSEQRKQEQLRLDYYKRLTLPLVYDNLCKGRVRLTENDWTAVCLNTDACFPGFTARLREAFPALRDDDVRLCCLLKMDMPLEITALIFGIEKASVSQRKQRLRQKMGLDCPLDDFLQAL